jgi:hypothetical protein
MASAEISGPRRLTVEFGRLQKPATSCKFRRLQLRFERISGLHYAFKTLAYTMINLRHYCQI